MRAISGKMFSSKGKDGSGLDLEVEVGRLYLGGRSGIEWDGGAIRSCC